VFAGHALAACGYVQRTADAYERERERERALLGINIIDLHDSFLPLEYMNMNRTALHDSSLNLSLSLITFLPWHTLSIWPHASFSFARLELAATNSEKSESWCLGYPRKHSIYRL